MTKQQIAVVPVDNKIPYTHLVPIVEALINDGNEFANSAIGSKNAGFYQDRDGWRCDLKKNLNFKLLRDRFIFPKSIRLSEEHDAILCENTWIEIKGGID